jgi:hypothetical protein
MEKGLDIPSTVSYTKNCQQRIPPPGGSARRGECMKDYILIFLAIADFLLKLWDRWKQRKKEKPP